MPTFNYLMLYDQNLAQIGDISAHAARRYCERHGYRFTCHTGLLDPKLHPAWNKIVAVRRHLAESDWTFWCDADTMICDPAFTLDRIMALIPHQSVAMSTDCSGLCSGVFLIRNCAWSVQYLNTLLFLGPQHPPAQPRPLHEQETMNLIASRFPAVGGQVVGIAESVIANPRSPASPIKPFIMHYWSATRSQERIATWMTEDSDLLSPASIKMRSSTGKTAPRRRPFVKGRAPATEILPQISQMGTDQRPEKQHRA